MSWWNAGNLWNSPDKWQTPYNTVVSDPRETALQRDEKLSLIDRFGKAFLRYQKVQSLGIAQFPWQQNPQVPSQGSPSHQLLTTQVGSGVPSPTFDRLIQQSIVSDIGERNALYLELDRIFGTDPIAATAIDEMIGGALGYDAITEVLPNSIYEKDDEAKDMASIADEIWQPVKDLITVEIMDLWARSLLRYGNSPIEVCGNESGIIEDLKGLPPYGFKINNNQQLQFFPGQQDAYIQYDAMNLTYVIAQWPEAAIVYAASRELSWNRYGIPPILPGLAYVRGLIRGTIVLADAREAAQPRTSVELGEPGKPVTDDQVAAFNYWSRKERKARGERITPNDIELFNGGGRASILAPTTNWFNDLNDIRWQASGTAMRFGMILARLIAPDTINRATLDRIEEITYAREYAFSIKFGTMFIKPIYDRVISWINEAYRKEQKSRGIARPRLLIDPRKVELNIEWKARRLPERLEAEAGMANQYWLNGLISREGAQEVGCRYLELDPNKEKTRLIEEQQAGIFPPQKGALSGSTADYINNSNSVNESSQLIAFRKRAQ